MSIPAVLLAAGASTRMGRPKQLLELEGEALLHRAARIALAAGCDPLVAVLGCGAPEMRAALGDLPLVCVDNREWEEGMASSIRAGLAALPGDAPAVLMLLCDQPGVDESLLRALMGAHREHGESMVACTYGGTRGVPALFPRRSFPGLMQLRGDRGARALLQGPDVVEVPFPEGARDLDRPEDLPVRDGASPANAP